MRGYPKNLNTKVDYLFVIQNFPKSEWEQDFQNLLASESDWMFVQNLPDKEAGITDSKHKIVEIPNLTDNNDDSAVSYAQYELKSNPEAKIYKLGFTKTEVKRIIKNGGM